MVEVVDNQSDNGGSFLGIDTRAMSNRRRKQKERQRELNAVNDPDLKRELAKGNTLISYFEYHPQ